MTPQLPTHSHSHPGQRSSHLATKIAGAETQHLSEAVKSLEIWSGTRPQTWSGSGELGWPQN